MRKLCLAVVWLGVVGPAMAQDAPPSGAAPVSGLAQLTAELEQHNPELKATRRQVDASLARISPAGAPPDPTFSAGYMSGFLRPPFFPSSSSPNAFQQFGVSQEIPFPGKLRLRSQMATTEADATRWVYEDVRLTLRSQLKSTYFQYVYYDRSLAILQRNKSLLEQLRQTAEARFRVNRAAQQDIIKAQLEISMILERDAMLRRERDAARVRINSLLYRAPETPVDPQLAFEVGDVPGSVAVLEGLITARAPAVRRAEQEINRGQQALALAQKELRPDFGVNVTTQKYVGGMPWMYGVDVMVKVPIFWQRKQRPMIAEAAATLEAGRRMRDNTVAMSTADAGEQFFALTTADRLATLYRDSIVPQARLALESSLASYQVGTVDFLTLLTNFSTVLTYEISYEEQLAQYRTALARLEPLVGTELIR